MFVLNYTSQFKKDIKTLKKRSSANSLLLTEFLQVLETNGVAGVDKKHRPHKLSGNYKDKLGSTY